MELWDEYDAKGVLTGQTLVRGEPIPEGRYHLVSEILVRHIDGDYLLMRRDPRKRNYGGWWEATAGGSALKGEDAYGCARRELLEETGITRGVLTPIGRFLSHDTIYENYLCVTDAEKTGITLQKGETVNFRWISEAAFIAFANSEEMIDVQKLRYQNYFEKIGYIKRHTA